MRRRVVIVGTIVLALMAIAIVAGLPRTLAALLEFSGEPRRLTIPVAGVARGALSDSWGAARSEGRHHEGIDIFAPRGTPVLAAAAGRVIKIGHDRLGGNVVDVAGAGARIYYYAHLESFASQLKVGDIVLPGATLGYVGTSGNAVGTPPHLHFGVYPLDNWLRAVDPYPLLLSARETPRAAPRPSASPRSRRGGK